MEQKKVFMKNETKPKLSLKKTVLLITLILLEILIGVYIIISESETNKFMRLFALITFSPFFAHIILNEIEDEKNKRTPSQSKSMDDDDYHPKK